MSHGVPAAADDLGFPGSINVLDPFGIYWCCIEILQNNQAPKEA